eukprot:SAG25_NODE_10745_length_324_cov_0.675556_1_plen_43_part_10
MLHTWRALQRTANVPMCQPVFELFLVHLTKYVIILNLGHSPLE